MVREFTGPETVRVTDPVNSPPPSAVVRVAVIVPASQVPQVLASYRSEPPLMVAVAPMTESDPPEIVAVQLSAST